MIESNIIKAITLWQPWASLVVMGYKKNETRNWMLNYRGILAVHAAQYKKLPHEIYVQIANAVGITPDKYRGSWLYYLENGTPAQEFGAVLGTVEVCGGIGTEGAKRLLHEGQFSDREIALGDYSDGRWAWDLRNPIKFDKPIPARGKQGLWNWEPSASPLITPDTLDLCKPCAEARKSIESITLVRGGNDNKITCVDCGRRRYGATYKKELAP